MAFRLMGRVRWSSPDPHGLWGASKAGARLLGHVFAGRLSGRHGAIRRSQQCSITYDDLGVMPILELSAGCVRACSSLIGRRQATDLSVAQSVEHQGEHLAGGCNPPDVATPTLGNASVVGLDLVPA